MANSKIISRKGGKPDGRRGQAQKPFWRIDTANNDRRAREIEAEADRDFEAGRSSKIIHEGNREFAQRIREGRLDQDYLFDNRLKRELPKLGLCKIRPERFRAMELPELERAVFFLGPVTMKERVSRTSPRGLTHRYLRDLINMRKEPNTQLWSREACAVEKEIYDAQQKKGCPISQSDVAARDELRKQSCDAPYPTEKLDKIRGRRKATIRGPKIK